MSSTTISSRRVKHFNVACSTGFCIAIPSVKCELNWDHSPVTSIFWMTSLDRISEPRFELNCISSGIFRAFYCCAGSFECSLKQSVGNFVRHGKCCRCEEYKTMKRQFFVFYNQYTIYCLIPQAILTGMKAKVIHQTSILRFDFNIEIVYAYLLHNA